MSRDGPIDPAEALNSLFAIVREEEASNPSFARRLVQAMGATVIFRGDDAVLSVDPVLVAASGPDEFRRTFLSFTPKELKAIIKEYGLATAQDMKGKNKAPLLVDLMWQGATSKRRDLTPGWRK